MLSRLAGFVCLSVVMVTTDCKGLWHTLYYHCFILEEYTGKVPGTQFQTVCIQGAQNIKP